MVSLTFCLVAEKGQGDVSSPRVKILAFSPEATSLRTWKGRLAALRIFVLADQPIVRTKAILFSISPFSDYFLYFSFFSLPFLASPSFGGGSWSTQMAFTDLVSKTFLLSNFLTNSFMPLGTHPVSPQFLLVLSDRWISYILAIKEKQFVGR